MPRKIRVEYADAIYHVMSRGDRREDIFLDDVDRGDDPVDQGDCGADALRQFQKCERAAAPVAAGSRNDEINEKRTILWFDPFTRCFSHAGRWPNKSSQRFVVENIIN